MATNQDFQGKTTSVVGLKKSIHKSLLKDGEYHHLLNGFPSSEQGDVPFIQNAPANEECVQINEFIIIGEKFVKEKNFYIIFSVSSDEETSEIGYFYPETCSYTSVITENCLGFKINYPIKSEYKYIGCELNIYFQDGYNRDRFINLDDIPYEKITVDGCQINQLDDEGNPIFDCDVINIQNDLEPPVVKVVAIEESGALYSGAYQFGVAYANINGDKQSSYYSITNITPIYEDRLGGYETVEGSSQNILTDKSIVLNFENLDIRYDYINLAVIRTIQGASIYELIATLPIATKSYTYTGRETTKLLSLDEISGLYPDYYNSKTITSANNYLIRANLSTQDETNYQPLANMIQLEWVATQMRADTFDGSYKNPLNTTNKVGYMRGEVYPFGIRFLLSNGRKTSVFHIPGRAKENSDGQILSTPSCELFELTIDGSCGDDTLSDIERWKVYDTAEKTYELTGEIDECFDGVVAKGEFAYWESTDTYPCNEEVWGDLAGQPIRHHKFPANETFHIHNSPYTYSAAASAAQSAYSEKSFIYPMGVRLKADINFYLSEAVLAGIISQEEADLVLGYEIVRGDRGNDKSIIAKGLLYNMRAYSKKNPFTDKYEDFLFPNYPYNDLRPDPYHKASSDYEDMDFDPYFPTTDITLSAGTDILPGEYGNPTSCTFTLTEDLVLEVSGNVYLKYSDVGGCCKLGVYYKTDDEDDARESFVVYSPTGCDSDEDSDYLDQYRQDMFTFHSPDIHFKRPSLGTFIVNHGVEFGSSKGRFEPVQGHPKLKPETRRDGMQMALSFKSEGNYNNFIPNTPGSGTLRRRLEDSGYIGANGFSKFPLDTQYEINNLFRESSVGLRVECNIDDPSVVDTSRYRMSPVNADDPSTLRDSSDGICPCKYVTDDKRRRRDDSKMSFEIDSECSEDFAWISSYYTSLNAKIPNQYGQIDTVVYVSTGKYHGKEYEKQNGPEITFGGDTFITRFSLKRKYSFFKVNYIGADAQGMDYRKKDTGPKTIFKVVNTKDGAFDRDAFVIDFKDSKLDCTIVESRLIRDIKNKNGFFYLFSYGVPHFFVESAINTELRYSKSNVWDTWYPKLKNTTFSDWTEEQKSPIVLDNSYFYNFNYSKQNTEEALFVQPADFNPDSQCKNTHPGTIIYSKQSSNNESTDNWLINLANDSYQAETSLGAIIDVHALDDQRVMVRYENGTQIFNAYDTLELEVTSITIGTGGMFAQRPQSFAETDTGYAGSQQKWVIDTTPFGTFFMDGKRTKIFLYSKTIEEISAYGMGDWFVNNIPLKFEEFLSQLSGLPNYDKFNRDNPYSFVGFSSVYDTRNNLWFLTKKDYILIDDSILNLISFSEEGMLQIQGRHGDELLSLDSRYFKEVGWTISYSPLSKSWVSFHSFKPNVYLGGNNEFFSARRRQAIYRHWSKALFQTYYGTLFPFEVTITTSNEQQVSILHSIEYNLKIQKYVNDYFQDIYENQKINFNKMFINTDNQCSGNLNLFLNDKTKPYDSLLYPIINASSIDILYSKVEGHKYRINQFLDIVEDKNNSLPVILTDSDGVSKQVNDANMNYNKVRSIQLENQKFRNEFFDVTLIQDATNEYKFILKSIINKTLKSSR